MQILNVKKEAPKLLKDWIWEGLGLHLGGSWDGLGVLLATFGRFLVVFRCCSKPICFKHKSKMGLKMPFGSMLPRF